MEREDVDIRARRHAALGDPTRLAMVDDLLRSDRSPSELAARFSLPSNLLAHHLAVLEEAGLVLRTPSSGDRRRRYVRADAGTAASVGLGGASATGPALFICTHNSARSQLAAAIWRAVTGDPATSAGTHPAERVRPGAVAAARHAGLDLESAAPRRLQAADLQDRRVVTVCDRAHEELAAEPAWWHWSIPDPVDQDTPEAYRAALEQIGHRITAIAGGIAWN